MLGIEGVSEGEILPTVEFSWTCGGGPGVPTHTPYPGSDAYHLDLNMYGLPVDLVLFVNWSNQMMVIAPMGRVVDGAFTPFNNHGDFDGNLFILGNTSDQGNIQQDPSGNAVLTGITVESDAIGTVTIPTAILAPM
ncbi:MAG: hypothetical protein AAFV53_33745 [Myxococcota bacterium]